MYDPFKKPTDGVPEQAIAPFGDPIQIEIAQRTKPALLLGALQHSPLFRYFYKDMKKFKANPTPMRKLMLELAMWVGGAIFLYIYFAS